MDGQRKTLTAVVDLLALGLAVYAQRHPEIPTRAQALDTLARSSARVSGWTWRLARWAERAYRREVGA